MTWTYIGVLVRGEQLITGVFMKTYRFVSSLAAAVLLGAVILSTSSAPQSKAADSDLVGKPAPAIKLDLLDGGKFDLADYKGKNVLIVDFWATWCGPCRAAMPVLMDVAKEYKDKGVLYFAVDLRENPATIKKFLQAQKWNIQVPLDKNGKVGD